MRAVVVVVFALAGCGRIWFEPLDDAGTDGVVADLAIDAPPCTAPFGPPLLVPALNTPQRDWAPAPSFDGLTMYFSSNRSGNEELYRSVRADLTAPWQPPTLITELAMAGDEEENPVPAADELEVYWGGSRVWRATRATTTDMFGPRSLVIASMTGLVNPQGPHIAPDQRTLYFTATASTEDMFYVKRASPMVPFEEAINTVAMVELNTAASEGWASLTADERVIVYTSNASGDLDLMTASRVDPTGPFGDIREVTELSSNADDEDAGISADGRTLWFASTRAGGMGDYDIYVATRDCP